MILSAAVKGQRVADSPSATTEETESMIPGTSSNEKTQVPQAVAPPQLSEVEAQTALKMMTNNRGGMRCWGCREDGHDLYNCPYLPWEVRMLFAKANFDYQSEVRGPATAMSHFRMRGHSPSRSRIQDGKDRNRKVNFSSPANVAGTSSGHRNSNFRNFDTKTKRVLVASKTSEPDVEVHGSEQSDTSSTSSGNWRRRITVLRDVIMLDRRTRE